MNNLKPLTPKKGYVTLCYLYVTLIYIVIDIVIYTLRDSGNRVTQDFQQIYRKNIRVFFVIKIKKAMLPMLPNPTTSYIYCPTNKYQGNIEVTQGNIRRSTLSIFFLIKKAVLRCKGVRFYQVHCYSHIKSSYTLPYTLHLDLFSSSHAAKSTTPRVFTLADSGTVRRVLVSGTVQPAALAARGWHNLKPRPALTTPPQNATQPTPLPRPPPPVNFPPPPYRPPPAPPRPPRPVARAANVWAVSREVFYLGFQTLTPWGDHKRRIEGTLHLSSSCLFCCASQIKSRFFIVAREFKYRGYFSMDRGYFFGLWGVLSRIIEGTFPRIEGTL